MCSSLRTVGKRFWGGLSKGLFRQPAPRGGGGLERGLVAPAPQHLQVHPPLMCTWACPTSHFVSSLRVGVGLHCLILRSIKRHTDSAFSPGRPCPCDGICAPKLDWNAPRAKSSDATKTGVSIAPRAPFNSPAPLPPPPGPPPRSPKVIGPNLSGPLADQISAAVFGASLFRPTIFFCASKNSAPFF